MPDTHIRGGAATTFERLVTETGAPSLSAAMRHLSDNDTTVPEDVYNPLRKASSTPADMARML
ncbi:serine hydrolase, partial [Streptomyces sp. SID11233]|nr:serine hydrolase [Streptomyces sp. SID11233]